MPVWLQTLTGIVAILSFGFTFYIFVISRKDKKRDEERQLQDTVEKLHLSSWTLEERLKLESRLSRLERIVDMIDEYMADLLIKTIGGKKR